VENGLGWNSERRKAVSGRTLGFGIIGQIGSRHSLSMLSRGAPGPWPCNPRPNHKCGASAVWTNLSRFDLRLQTGLSRLQNHKEGSESSSNRDKFPTLRKRHIYDLVGLQGKAWSHRGDMARAGYDLTNYFRSRVSDLKRCRRSEFIQSFPLTGRIVVSFEDKSRGVLDNHPKTGDGDEHGFRRRSQVAGNQTRVRGRFPCI